MAFHRISSGYRSRLKFKDYASRCLKVEERLKGSGKLGARRVLREWFVPHFLDCDDCFVRWVTG